MSTKSKVPPRPRLNVKNPENGIIEAYWRADGREVTKSLNTTDWAAAGRAIEPLIMQWKLGRTIGAEYTFGMGAANLLSHYRDTSTRTFRALELMWSRIAPLWHDKSIETTPGSDYTKFSTACVNGTAHLRYKYSTKGHGLNKATVRNMQRFLKRVREFALANGNVAVLPEWPQSYGRNKPKAIHHTKEQVAEVFRRVSMLRVPGTPPTPLQLLIALGYCTGARYRDMLNLKITDVQGDRINYLEQRKRPSNKGAGKPKINIDLRPLLVEAIAEAKRRGTLFLLATERRVKGMPVSYPVCDLSAQARTFFEGLIAEGVLPTGSTIHTMRHTYITLALAANPHLLPTIAADVGDTPATIYSVYVHPNKDGDASAAISLYSGTSPLRVVK